MKLSFKLSAIITTLVTVVLSVSTYVSLDRQAVELAERYEHDGQLVIEATNKVFLDAIWEVNPELAESGMEPFFKNPNLMSIEIIEQEGSFFAGMKRAKVGEKPVSIVEGITDVSKLKFNEVNPLETEFHERVNSLKDTNLMKFFARLVKVSEEGDEVNKLGSVIVRYSTESLGFILRKALMSAIYLALIMVACVVGPILIFLQLSVLKPLAVISHASDRVAHGKIEKVEHTDVRDELGILQRSFNEMVDGIIKNMEGQAEQSRMEAELQTTKLVQESLFPKEKSGSIGNFSFASHFQSADECGGDWFGFHLIGENKDKILILLGDVTGHGTPSAFVTAVVKGYCDSLKLRPDGDLTPQKVLTELDEEVASCSSGKRMMTMFAAIIDSTQNKLTFASAGHNHPYIRRGSLPSPYESYEDTGYTGEKTRFC